MAIIISRYVKGKKQVFCYDESNPMICHDKPTAYSFLKQNGYAPKDSTDEDLERMFNFETINLK